MTEGKPPTYRIFDGKHVVITISNRGDKYRTRIGLKRVEAERMAEHGRKKGTSIPIDQSFYPHMLSIGLQGSASMMAEE